jgi:hypothetical protein
MSDDGFQQAISVATGDVVKVRRRFGDIQQLLTKAARCSAQMPGFVTSDDVAATVDATS